MRCTRCGHEWRTLATVAAVSAPPQVAITPPPVPSPPAAPAAAPRSIFSPPPAAVPAASPPAAAPPVFSPPPAAPPVFSPPPPEPPVFSPPPEPAKPAAQWPPLPPAFPATEAPRFGQPVDSTAYNDFLKAKAEEVPDEPTLMGVPVPIPQPDEPTLMGVPVPAFEITGGPLYEPPAAPMALPEPVPEPVPAPAPAAELPAFLNPEHAAAPSADPAAPPTPDRFAELVYAARNKSIEYEPEPLPPGPKVRTSNFPAFLILLLLFILASLALEHRIIVHYFPMTAKFYAMAGLH